MIKLVSFIIRAALLIALAVWLADQPGTAKIVWHDYVIETSAAFLAVTAIAVGFVFYLLFRIWHFLSHGPRLWRMGRQLRKLRQGQDDLARGLVAIAGGSAGEAGRFSVLARKRLGVTTATQLLQAQAAQLAGDHQTARALFRALTTKGESAVLGYRGLITEARRAGDWREVESLTSELARAKPDTPWLNLMRFELSTRRLAWQEATQALQGLAKTELLPPEQLRQYRAALFVAMSQHEAAQGRYQSALQFAEQATRQRAEWLPALLNLAQAQVNAGHRRAAYRTIERHWTQHKHPQLAALYRQAEGDPLDAYKRVVKLVQDKEPAGAARLALAEAALSADIWGEARRHLIALISAGDATQGVYRLLARLERRESGDEVAATRWLTRAIDAPQDPTWVCPSCGGVHETWQAVCGHCGSFGTLEWRSLGVSRTKLQAQVPLAIGDWGRL
ncbi:MAG: hypothetical protein JO126_03760 [Alphaproteobacteria bacterium]|nr:hypothetical protein [Alphaproteobacteria bacterium]